MALPAAPPGLFSNLFGDISKWENPEPDYGTLVTSLGVSALTNPHCRDGLVQLATQTPVVVVFVASAESHSIYIAHSLTLFPADVTDVTAMDGLGVGLVGNNFDSAVPVVFPQTFFTVIADTRALDIVTAQGATGHGAAPPVFRFGPHAAGTANTNTLRARRAMFLPPKLAALALSSAPADGRYMLLGFYNTFLQGPLASADATVVTAIEPLANWWRLACTKRA